MVGHLQQFKLDVTTQRGKQMVGLGAYCVSGRTFQRSVLLEGLVILFHVLLSLVDCGDLFVIPLVYHPPHWLRKVSSVF